MAVEAEVMVGAEEVTVVVLEATVVASEVLGMGVSDTAEDSNMAGVSRTAEASNMTVALKGENTGDMGGTAAGMGGAFTEADTMGGSLAAAGLATPSITAILTGDLPGYGLTFGFGGSRWHRRYWHGHYLHR